MTRAGLLRYSGAVLLILAATGVRVLLHPFLQTRLPFGPYLLAVLLTAWYGGAGPALLAAVVGSLVAAYDLADTSEVVVLAINLAVALAGIFFMRALRQAREKAEKSAADIQAATDRTRTILESISDGFCAFDADWRYVYVNERAAKLIRRERETLIGKHLWNDFPGARESKAYEEFHRAVAQRVPVHFEEYYAPFDAWVEVDAYPSADGLSVFARDITARKKSEDARLHLAAIVESSQDAITSKTLEGIILTWNPGAERLYGYTAREMIGRPIATLAPHDRENELPGILERIRRGEAVRSYETERLRKDGQRIHVSLTVSPVKNLAGQIIAASAVARDISYSKRADRRFHLAVESAPNAMVMVNQEGKIVLVNSQTEKLFGYNRDELMGMPIEMLVPQRFRHSHPEHRRGFLADPQVRPMGAGRDLFGSRRDGSEFPVEIGLNPIETAEGIWVLGAIVDITERKRSEEERVQLLAREQEARRAAEQAAERTARIQAVTAALSAAVTPKQVAEIAIHEGIAAMGGNAGVVAVVPGEGRSPEILVAVDYPAQVIEAWRQSAVTLWDTPLGEAVRTGEPVWLESVEALVEKYPHLTGVARAIGGGARAALPLQVQGRTVGAMWLSFGAPRAFSADDRSLLMTLAQQCAQAMERARLFESEQAARAAAESASRLKDEFLATVSHELRTPLTAILGWARMLSYPTLDEATREKAIETIQRNAKAQDRLIEDILDVSRIITGKLRLDVQVTDLQPVIQAAVEVLLPAAEAKGIRVHQVLDPNSGTVLGDAQRLQQVAWNLLSNAIKFTPKGGRVMIVLQRINSHTELTVSDTGKGISPDFLPYVFDRFRQADSSTIRAHEGLGLGLAIVRHLVELHGGTVHADSKGEGQGATFTVRLPLVPVSYSPSTKASEEERVHPTAEPGVGVPSPRLLLRGVRVLVAEDDADARELLSTVLAKSGARVTTAADSAEALRIFQETSPDVLVADIGMPGEDGYGLIRRVRAREAEQRQERIPAIALTAYARVQDRLQALEAGYQIHLSKPIEPTELVLTIAGLLRRTGAGAPGGDSSTEPRR